MPEHQTTSLSAVRAVTAVSYNASTGNTGYQINGFTGILYPSNDSGANQSVAVGASALSGQIGSSAAYQNTAIGYKAMGNSNTMTTASVRNTAVGLSALGALTQGTDNAAMGVNALASNTTGTGNIGIGRLAGQQNVTGSSNTFIGTAAGQGASGQSNSFNTAVGASALAAVTTSGGNVAVGLSALAAVTSGSGTNTAIGTNAGNNLTTGTNDIFIGNGVQAPAVGTSNWLNIGNGIYETLAAPTISSGFGTSPSVVNGTSSASFTVNVGTGGSATSGVIAFPTAAPNGWNCSAVNNTASATLVTECVTTSTTTTTCSSYSRTTGVLTAWGASNVLGIRCMGY